MTKKKILIVDDEPNLTKMLKLNLDDLGLYETMAINDSNIAMQSIKDYMPDLILLDVMMPGLQGNEIASMVLDDPDTAHIKIVFLTAIVTKSEAPRGENTIGGRKFIAKPVQIEDLASILKEELG